MKGKSVIAIEIDDYKNEIGRKEYKSMYAAGKYLNINPWLIKYCCEWKNNVKSGFSKNDGRRYRFIYEYFFSKYIV